MQAAVAIQPSGLPVDLQQLEDAARAVGRSVLASKAAEVDRDSLWPADGMTALANAGLMGLHVPRRLGGYEQGLLALAVVTEELGKHCGSTAMCFGMHSVATKVLASKATPDQERRFLRPIAEGRHITSVALSESGSGAHFFLPRTHFRPHEGDFVVSGQKSFVTSGRYADSYVVSAVPPGEELDAGAFTCLVVEADASGLEWHPPWHGFGMRGNHSCALTLRDAQVPRANLLGNEGDQVWYVFEVVAPYFLTAMAGVYLGIAQAALDAAIAHLKARRHAHTGETLSEMPVLWHDVADAWIEVESTRQLLRHAAREADDDKPNASLALFAAKAKVAQVATTVTDAAMALTGGRGYTEDGPIARLHRDARASHVMSPTTHILKNWLGRSLLDLPLLA